jgi:hypothetical protein
MGGLRPMQRRTLLGAIGSLRVLTSCHAAAVPAAPASTGSGIIDALVKAAQREGSLTYYHVTSIEVTGASTSAFSERFGVRPPSPIQPSRSYRVGTVSSAFRTEPGANLCFEAGSATAIFYRKCNVLVQ